MAKKILVITKSNKEILSNMLENSGYAVVGNANYGEGGISLLQDFGMQKPNLAMIDYQLPDMNGLDVAEEIMRIRPSVSVILCIRRDDPDYHEVKKRARALGIRCILCYSFHQNDMVKAVETALKRSLFSEPVFRVFGGTEEESAPMRSAKWLEREIRNPKNHILLADSAPFLQKIMGDFLKKADYEIVGAAQNDQECMKIIREQCPDMVILDYMEREEGSDRMELIRQIHKMDDVIHIVLRVNKEKYPDYERIINQAERNGITGAFLTPFYPDTFLREVKRLLG